MSLDFVILAAGNSSRMKSLLPKKFQELAEKPIVRYIIDVCKQVAHNDIIVVTNKEFKENENFSDTKVCVQEIMNGTAGAVKSALHLLKSDYTIVLCSDMPFIENKHLESLISDKNDISFIAMQLPEEFSETSYGRVIKSDSQKFSKIVEYKNASETEKQCLMANSGVYKIKTSLIKKYIDFIKPDETSSELYFTDLINVLKNENLDISIIEEKEYWPFLGVNTMSDLALAEELTQCKLRNNFMEKGVKFHDPKSVYLSFDTIIEEDVVIEQNVIIKQNVVIKKGATVKAFSYIEDCELCENSIVGPFARIRGNSKLMENSEIGNFVEIKSSVIGNKTKIKHLAYIGDTTIGTKSNIGAGTITCNYDGVRKHKTLIGDNVMVGANCSLIAPLEIKSDSLLGAGSVVNADVPPNSLAISRPKLEIKQRKPNP
ncbi:MAG: bifunctional UDP-N-acetylglucosamine diphosphorylase/glucosamine-1-phosphate N-acetyltransferase GlmU [Holosporales bacterium]|jgi:bifunctional UDP-N-acetylglucosamine pyrophosphorylase/glucosamine-1-phosphate N-acetyltransferase|nr:bifunctional UDP-N-acetylglucosamine diphosphorylase/glucosamine-1-phosphate N-acetyltransferase GlmU [Holosporales bacterium]